MRTAIVALAVLAAPRPAEACALGSSDIPIIVPSSAGVPLNATITVWMNDEVARRATIEVRPKGGQPIKVTRRESGAARTVVVELIPDQPLKPRTTYQVTAASFTQTFTTGTAKDTSAPTWAANPSNAKYIKPIGAIGSCLNQHPHLEVDLPGNEGSLRVGVWQGDLDYTKPPKTYLSMTGKRVRIGDFSIAVAANLDVPEVEKLKLGFKLFDLAGNASEAKEITVDTRVAKEELR